jgi:hypothetical protein
MNAACGAAGKNSNDRVGECANAAGARAGRRFSRDPGDQFDGLGRTLRSPQAREGDSLATEVAALSALIAPAFGVETGVLRL